MLFVLFIKLLVILSVFASVLLLLAFGGLAIWAAGHAAIFLFNHWQWAIGGFCFLALWGIVINRIKRRRMARLQVKGNSE